MLLSDVRLFQFPNNDSVDEGSGLFVARRGSMVQAYERASRTAANDLPVLLVGEAGVGKLTLAHRIHAMSARRNGPFVRSSCTALSREALVESIETAKGGTLFLEEVHELPSSAQSELVRLLDAAELAPPSAPQTPAAARIIAAAERSLDADVRDGRFLAGLFFLLDGLTIAIPPLRERSDELTGLASTILGEARRRVMPETIGALAAHEWPGNIRELRSVLRRAVALSNGGPIRPEHVVISSVARALVERTELPATRVKTVHPDAARTAAAPVNEDERERIVRALTQTGGNQRRAAELLGISRRTLVTRLTQLDLPRPRK